MVLSPRGKKLELKKKSFFVESGRNERVQLSFWGLEHRAEIGFCKMVQLFFGLFFVVFRLCFHKGEGRSSPRWCGRERRLTTQVPAPWFYESLNHLATYILCTSAWKCAPFSPVFIAGIYPISRPLLDKLATIITTRIRRFTN
jgi:hypothetical protein